MIRIRVLDLQMELPWLSVLKQSLAHLRKSYPNQMMQHCAVSCRSRHVCHCADTMGHRTSCTSGKEIPSFPSQILSRFKEMIATNYFSGKLMMQKVRVPYLKNLKSVEDLFFALQSFAIVFVLRPPTHASECPNIAKMRCLLLIFNHGAKRNSSFVPTTALNLGNRHLCISDGRP